MEPLTIVIASALIGKGIYNKRAEKLHRQKLLTLHACKLDEIIKDKDDDYIIEYKCGNHRANFIKYYDYRHDTVKSEYRWNNVTNVVQFTLMDKWVNPKLCLSDNGYRDTKILPYVEAINYSMKKYYHDISKYEFTSANVMIKEKEEYNIYAYGRNINGKFKPDIISDDYDLLIDRIVDKCYIPYIVSGCGLLSICAALHY